MANILANIKCQNHLCQIICCKYEGLLDTVYIYIFNNLSIFSRVNIYLIN